MSTWTPLHIELMMHYHCTPVALPNADAPVVVDYTSDLLKHGLIFVDRKCPSGYRSTDKGQAFIALLCRTPLPEMRWVDPEGREIKP